MSKKNNFISLIIMSILFIVFFLIFLKLLAPKTISVDNNLSSSNVIMDSNSLNTQKSSVSSRAHDDSEQVTGGPEYVSGDSEQVTDDTKTPSENDIKLIVDDFLGDKKKINNLGAIHEVLALDDIHILLDKLSVSDLNSEKLIRNLNYKKFIDQALTKASGVTLDRMECGHDICVLQLTAYTQDKNALEAFTNDISNVEDNVRMYFFTREDINRGHGIERRIIFSVNPEIKGFKIPLGAIEKK